MNLRKHSILFAAMLMVLLLSQTVYGQIISIHVKNEPERFERIRGIRANGDYYVSANSFSEVLGLQYFYEPRLEKFEINLDGNKVVFANDNHFILVGNDVYQLPVEVRNFRSELHFPLRGVSRILDRYLPGSYEFFENDRMLEIYYSGEINITDINIEEKANGTLIKIKTKKVFDKDLVDWFDKTKYTLNLSFFKGALDTLQLTNTETQGLVLRTTAFQLEETAQLTFKLSRYVDSHEVIEDPAKREINISLIHKNADRPEPPDNIDIADIITAPETEELVAQDKESWELDTIIIDPGHGGRDPGTIGRDGTKEKDLALDIAKRLGSLLEKSKLVKNIVFTRENDKYVSLRRRSEIANRSNGKLFVSIHINSNDNARVRGFETYFLRPGKNDDATEVLEVVQRENNVVNLYDDGDSDRLLTEEDKMVLAMTQSAFVKESELLSMLISEGLRRKINWPDRGIKQAGFQVLWEVSMPNVLVELGFITNSGQLGDLKTRAIRQRLAEGIFEGIKKFKDQARR